MARIFFYHRRAKRIGEQGLGNKESARLPPMWYGFDSGCHIWVKFVVGSPLVPRVFLRFFGFSSTVTSTLKFQLKSKLAKTDVPSSLNNVIYLMCHHYAYLL